MAKFTQWISSVGSKVQEVITSRLGPTLDPSFKMLLIGETGSGKTSLINLFCNCALIESLGGDEQQLGMQMSKVKAFHDITLESSESKKMESKTSGAKEYFTMLNKLDIGIIDTPGFGDTRGFEKDSENIKKIIEILKHTEHINCVCLVINGRSARLTSSIKYVLSEITTILPQEVVNNLIVIFSNTNDELELTFDVEELNRYFHKKITSDKIFYIENPCCKLLKAQTKKSLSEDATQGLARSFNVTHKVLQRMHGVVKSFKPVHTFHFISLYEKKQEVEKKVIIIMAKFDQQRELDERIKVQQKEIEAALNQKDLYSNYKTTNTFKRHNPKETQSHNTLCGAKQCYSNCHVPCYLEKSFDKETFKGCRAIEKDGYCNVCHHHYSHHYHNEVIFVEEECEEELIDSKMKKEFEKSKSMEERAKMLMQQSQKRKERSEKEKEKLSKELLIVLDEFHAKGMNRNYAKLLQTQIDIIKLRIEDADVLDTAPLRKTKEELETKLIVVQKTLKEEPWSKKDIQNSKEWACSCLGLDPKSSLASKQINAAFKQVAKIYHPDKGGDDEHFKRIQCAKDFLLKIINN